MTKPNQRRREVRVKTSSTPSAAAVTTHITLNSNLLTRCMFMWIRAAKNKTPNRVRMRDVSTTSVLPPRTCKADRFETNSHFIQNLLEYFFATVRRSMSLWGSFLLLLLHYPQLLPPSLSFQSLDSIGDFYPQQLTVSEQAGVYRHVRGHFSYVTQSREFGA